jgi:hypothetical protein
MQPEIKEGGSLTVTAVLILAVLTILGVSVGKMATTELWISRNEAILGKNFYLAEGGLGREAQELGNGSYTVRDVFHPSLVATSSSTDLPAPAPHTVGDEPYDFAVAYSGFSVPSKGFSARAFSRYNYDIDVRKNSTHMEARYYTIGPKPQ